MSCNLRSRNSPVPLDSRQPTAPTRVRRRRTIRVPPSPPRTTDARAGPDAERPPDRRRRGPVPDRSRGSCDSPCHDGAPRRSGFPLLHCLSSLCCPSPVPCLSQLRRLRKWHCLSASRWRASSPTTTTTCTAATNVRTDGRTSCQRHQRLSPASTCARERGSRKVAVPTCTASAPGHEHLHRIHAAGHAAHTDDPDFQGKAARQSCTARTATGRMRRDPGGLRRLKSRPQPVGAPTGSIGHPQQGVHQHQGLCPGVQGGPGDVGEIGQSLGLSFTHRGSPQTAAAATASAVARAEWANMRLRSSRRLGQLTLTSTATTPGRPGQQSAPPVGRSSTRRPQMLATTRAPCFDQKREGASLSDPGRPPPAPAVRPS